jgi:hypothetical protein
LSTSPSDSSTIEWPSFEPSWIERDATQLTCWVGGFALPLGAKQRRIGAAISPGRHPRGPKAPRGAARHHVAFEAVLRAGRPNIHWSFLAHRRVGARESRAWAPPGASHAHSALVAFRRSLRRCKFPMFRVLSARSAEIDGRACDRGVDGASVQGKGTVRGILPLSAGVVFRGCTTHKARYIGGVLEMHLRASRGHSRILQFYPLLSRLLFFEVPR